MALLSPRVLGVLGLALLLGSCDGRSEVGHLDVELYTEPVECGPADHCFDVATGAVAEADGVVTWAFLSTETTQHAPDGLFLYLRLERPDGRVAHVEIDTPLYPGVEGPAVSYVEYEGQEVVFESDSARGVIRLPRDLRGAACDCTDGQLELEVADSARGEQRRLSRGRFSWDASFCVASTLFRELPEDEVEVRRFDACLREYDPPPYDPPRRDPDPYDPYYDDPYYDGGCGCQSDSSYDSGGCEADGCSGSGSSGGSDGCSCESDSSSGSSGCEGDTSDSDAGCGGDDSSSSACDGDPAAPVARLHRHRHRRGRPPWTYGPFQAAVFIGLGFLYMRRRR